MVFKNMFYNGARVRRLIAVFQESDGVLASGGQQGRQTWDGLEKYVGRRRDGTLVYNKSGGSPEVPGRQAQVGTWVI